MHCNKKNVPTIIFFHHKHYCSRTVHFSRLEAAVYKTSMVCSGKMDRLVHCWNTFQFALFGIRVKGKEKYFSSKEFDFNFK